MQADSQPDSFFTPDVQGMIAAVDTGFMSTSDDRRAPIEFINGDVGVLFVLHCGPPDEATGALHIGAVLTELSQWPGADSRYCKRVEQQMKRAVFLVAVVW